jgi:hypothetical protein
MYRRLQLCTVLVAAVAGTDYTKVGIWRDVRRAVNVDFVSASNFRHKCIRRDASFRLLQGKLLAEIVEISISASCCCRPRGVSMFACRR